MDSLNTIPNSGSFGDVSAKLNDNFSKVRQSLTTMENVVIANKGYFDTLASLQAAFPSPKDGNTAYVANVASSTGYYIYNVVSGVWTATTTEAPSVDVEISNYAQHGYSSSPKTLKQVDDEIVQLAGDVSDYAVSDIKNKLYPQNIPFSDLSIYGTIIGTTGGIGYQSASYNSIRSKIPYGAKKIIYRKYAATQYGLVLTTAEDAFSGFIAGFNWDGNGSDEGEIDLSLYPQARGFAYSWAIANSENFRFNFLIDVDISDIKQKSEIALSRIDNIISIQNLVIGANSAMDGPASWVAQLGSPVFDINTTVAGKLYIKQPLSGNANIILPYILTLGVRYKVGIKARLRAGTAVTTRVGAFASQITPGSLIFTPTGTETYYEGEIIAENTNLSIGFIGCNGSEYEFDDVYVENLDAINLDNLSLRIEAIESSESEAASLSFNTEHFLSSLSRYDKPLTKLFVNGDSLMANQIGGVVPDFEGEGAFPLMLSVNNIPRRIYDLISWNKPVWRNLFHVDWTKSGWTDDKASVLQRYHNLEHYYLATNGATASITIPSGYENFAILCRKSTTAGSLNVTIDGVAVTVGNANPTMTAAFNNSFHVEEYLGISPTGDKTLLIESVGANHVWGIMYWSGNTLMVSNIARGGHDMGMLKNYWNAEFVQNNPDAIIFEIPELNQLRGTIEGGLLDLEYFVNELKWKDHCFMSCNALGTDPSDGTPNYWDSYLDPNQRDFNDAFRNLLFKAGEPFIDVFHAFELKVLNRGGTLEDGDCGLWYTHDGQHGSEAGQREWWNIIRYVFENKPIRYSE